MKQIKGKATGTDGIDKTKYNENVTENIDNLLNKMKRFSYKLKAVRRTYIPKSGSDKLRSLRIPSYEDKLVHEVNQLIITKKVIFIVDAYIKGFFDNVNHEWLINFLENNVQDKNFIK